MYLDKMHGGPAVSGAGTQEILWYTLLMVSLPDLQGGLTYHIIANPFMVRYCDQSHDSIDAQLPSSHQR